MKTFCSRPITLEPLGSPRSDDIGAVALSSTPDLRHTLAATSCSAHGSREQSKDDLAAVGFVQ